MRVFFVFIFFYISLDTFSQESLELLQKVLRVNKEETTRNYDLTYQLYRSDNLNKPVTSYHGKVVQKNQLIYQVIEQTTVVQNTEIAVTIDNDEKIMQLSEPIPNLNNQELEMITKECDSVSFVIVKDQIIFTLALNPTSQLPLNKVIIRADKFNYRVSNMEFHYSNLQDFSEEMFVTDYGYPVLSISIKNYNVSIDGYEKLLDMKNYVVKVGNSYNASKDFPTYTLIDKRN